MAEENPSFTDESNQGEEELYDLLIPPGVPRKMIIEIAEKFGVELANRKERMFFANMGGDEREILAFRGRKEVLEELHPYMMNELRKFVGDESPD